MTRVLLGGRNRKVPTVDGGADGEADDEADGVTGRTTTNRPALVLSAKGDLPA